MQVFQNKQTHQGSVVRELAVRAKIMPDKMAYRLLSAEGIEQEVTYRQLYQRMQTMAGLLREKQLAPGSRVMLLFPQGLEVIVALLACNYCGLLPIAMNIPGRNRRLQKWENIAKQAEVVAVLTTKERCKVLQETLAASPSLQKLPVWSESAESGASVAAGEPTEQKLAFLQYTSGSTGEPKGVMVTHQSLCRNLAALETRFGIVPDSCMVSWLPFYHDMGLILGILQGIYTGHTVVLMVPADFMQEPLLWAQAICDFQATHTVAPNFAYELLADKLVNLPPHKQNSYQLHSLQRAICGAEPVQLQTLRRFLKAAKPLGLRSSALSPGYGLAEASLVVSAYLPGAESRWLKLDREKLRNKKVQVLAEGILTGVGEETPSQTAEVILVGNGQVIDGHKLCLHRSDIGYGQQPYEIGEICFQGPSVTAGYWGRPDSTAQVFVDKEKTGGIWLHTGDLGFVDARGEVYVVGRSKDVIILRGMNYYPQDIEQASCQAHPALRTDGAAAFGIDSNGEEKLILVQEVERASLRKPRCDEWAQAIRNQVRELHEIVPADILFVPPMHVPRTTSGKIQRSKARQMYQQQAWPRLIGRSQQDQMPRPVLPADGWGKEELRKYVAALVAYYLALPAANLDMRRSFGELGMNSALYLKISQELAEALRQDVPPVTLFNYPTVDSLSQHLWQDGQTSGRSRIDKTGIR